MSVFYKQFGAEYNCDAYGAGAYDSDQVCGTSTDAGGLANTGTNVIAGVTGGALLIVVAVVLLVRTRHKARKSAE